MSSLSELSKRNAVLDRGRMLVGSSLVLLPKVFDVSMNARTHFRPNDMQSRNGSARRLWSALSMGS